MEYAIYNLLTNAVKYSPANTTVTIGGSRPNGQLRIFPWPIKGLAWTKRS